jgi:HEXXH motif-containing protein
VSGATESIHDYCKQFSHPGREFNDAVFSTILTAHGSHVAAAFVNKHRNNIVSCSQGLADLLSIGHNWPVRGVWDVSFGLAQHHEGGPSLLSTAAQMALSLMSAGVPARWSASFTTPVHLRFASRNLRSLIQIAVASDGIRVEIEGKSVDGTQSWIFERDRADWRAASLAPSPRIGGGAGIELLLASDLPDCELDEAAAAGLPPVTQFMPDMARPFEDALEFLSAFTPSYKRWVDRVLTGIVLYQRNEAKSGSGSRGDMPGVIACSLSFDRTELAEVMVHEACHQYFYVATRVGPADDGRDNTLYYSPPVKRERPIDRILIAYHAFANVLVWYDEVVRAGADDHGAIARREALLRPQVEVLEKTLAANQNLTELGEALFVPLKQELEDVRE